MIVSDLSPPAEEVLEPAVPSTGLPLGPSWQEQDKILRDMWLQNQTPQAISEALNRSFPAIMTRAARLGLPRRSAPGRKPGRRPLDDKGMPISPVTRSMARSVQSTAQVAPTTSSRVCLMCLNKFESLGRQNRICPSCKGSSEYESASALPELHVPT